ncbi:MAG TPA: hypothetical protein VFN09_15535 [Rhodanobacteraceae bacterium]|nr:hypothetical protein [Rhodanobacteraceae bacterium]
MNDTQNETLDALLQQQFAGPVADDGFAERVMQRLPPRRRRAWPLAAGVLAGMVTCGLCLMYSPGLHAGWRDWLLGRVSVAALVLFVVMAGMSALAAWWAMTEAGEVGSG